MNRLLSACAASAGLAACATTDGDDGMSEAAARRLAAFERTGQTVNCLPVRNISQITPLDDRHFLVRQGVSQYYLNIVNGRCRNADRPSNRIQYTTTIATLCQNEIISVVDNIQGFFVSSCSLGEFERLERKERGEDSEENGVNGASDD